MPQKRLDFSGSVIIFFILLFVYAKWGPALPFSVSNQTRGEPFVVQGTGKVSVAPDVAKVTFGITQNGQSLKSVEELVNQKSKTLTDSLKKLGVDDSDIKTTSYNVSPQYDYTNQTQKVIGYQVSTDYEVTIKDLDNINNIVESATANGANIVGSVNFTLSDKLKKDITQEAREEAVVEAKNKAQGLAKASGISLGKIINVSESEGGIPRPIPVLSKADVEVTQEVIQPNIEPGTTDVILTVSLSYEVR